MARRPAMVPVPAGWFWMGSEAGPDNERPVHRVWVDAFELGAYQVTNAAYAVFLAATGRPAPRCWEQPQFNLPEQPVVGVSWFEAVAYCEWLSAAQGRRYRLPTEAEWERAARGGVEGRLYAWGDDPPQLFSDYALRWQEGPEPVGDFFPNPYGLYNMGDNVHEWCADWYHAEYYAASPERNPHGPECGTRRASRGGSWRHRVKVSRVAARSSISPAFQYADYGFRVAADIKIGG